MSIVVCTGARCRIEYARAANGTYPAQEFLLYLEEEPNRHRDLASLQHLFQVFCQQGAIRNREHFKVVEKTNLVEFKKHQVRVLAFHGGQGLLLLAAGLIKKANDLPPTEINRAERIRQEHLDWTEQQRAKKGNSK